MESLRSGSVFQNPEPSPLFQPKGIVTETFKFSKDVDLGLQRRNKQGQRLNLIQGEMALIIALFGKKKLKNLLQNTDVFHPPQEERTEIN